MSSSIKDVVIWTGAGQIGMAIARRIGYGKKIVVGDKNFKNVSAIAKIMTDAGFDIVPAGMDLGNRESILNFIEEARKFARFRL